MTTLQLNKRMTIQILLFCLLILCFFYLCSEVSTAASRLSSRDASDTLILLVELATESGDNYIAAKSIFADLLMDYAGHMKRRELHWLLKIPPFMEKNVAGELERVRKNLKETAQINNCNAINEARDSILKVLKKSDLFTGQPTITSMPEVMSGELQKAIISSLNEANKKVEDYAHNKSRTVDDAKTVCLANRKAIVYLFLARFNYQEFVDGEAVRKFRTSIEQTIYYNRLLQEADKDVEGSHYKLLDKYTSAEMRRLGLLQAIMDNDIQKARTSLEISLMEAIPDFQPLS